MTSHGRRCLTVLIAASFAALGCRLDRPLGPGSKCCTGANRPTLSEIRRLPNVNSPSPSVITASYEVEEDTLPAPRQPLTESARGGPPELLPGPHVLQLRDVIVSVQDSYPLLRSAWLEFEVAAGRELSAWGEFDINAAAKSVNAPMGFYKNYRHSIFLEKPLFGGGYMFGGYKIGRGFFQPWFKERETNDGGEFSIGLGAPLLKNRAIDKRRADLFRAELAQEAVQPAVRTEFLEFARMASRVYWSWVAAGQKLQAQHELLDLAQDRANQIEQRVDAGDLGRIALINNQQLIAVRETKVIEAERKVQETGIKLSLFYRTPQGEPQVPQDSQLPGGFPNSCDPDPDQVDADIKLAIKASPELAELELVSEQVRVELDRAKNALLPKLDAGVLAAKDVGAEGSPDLGKTPFQLEAGLFADVPLQRRQARGKVESARAKIAQINAKREFVINKVTAAVQDAVSALEAAAGRIERGTTNLRLAKETLELGRAQFDAGDIDLVELNIFETAVNDARLILIDAQADFFSALADYRAAMALDPLTDDFQDSGQPANDLP